MPDGSTYKPPATGLNWRQSVRIRLLVIAILPMLVVMPLFLSIVVLNWSNRFDALLIAKVNGELTIAHQYLERIRERASEQVAALGASARFAETISRDDREQLRDFLEAERKRYGFDFLYYTHGTSETVSSPKFKGAVSPTDWPVVQSALNGRTNTEIDIFDAAALAAISDDLAERAAIRLVPTRAAAPTDKTEETRGMVIHTAAPVESGSGALVAGVLLNRNLDFIDTINDLVYPEQSLTEGSRGTATLFLEDVRVSTNVRLFENVRALGTRVSVAVRDAVLGRGEKWLDRAFVVNDWYISAYEPILDSFGNRVGMLYVGFLDSPFRAAKLRTLWMIAGGFALVLLLSVPVFLRWARSIFRPLEAMVGTIGQVEAGDLGARTLIHGRDDEIGRVARQMDHLLDQVQERDRRLRVWAEELEQRVAERTRELREANQRLEATTQQLVVSEKLAAIGEITAGIAHEINNPIAVIQGNLDVIRENLGDEALPLQTEFSLIYEQVHSINILVNKLLQFARPEEYAGTVEHHIPNEVVNDSIPLVHHLLSKVAIELTLELGATRPVAMNRTELQQVLINLIVNAIHAMPDGGKLTIATRDADHDGVEGVEIAVTDTGVGMSPETLKSVFDPFFTTKREEGTGLGLSISRKLVSRAGGQMRVESQLGQGTTFFVWLPTVDAGD